MLFRQHTGSTVARKGLRKKGESSTKRAIEVRNKNDYDERTPILQRNYFELESVAKDWRLLSAELNIR